MQPDTEQHQNPQPRPEHRPTRERPVWVRCPGFRCLAYFDINGKWRSLAKDEELPQVLQVLDTP